MPSAIEPADDDPEGPAQVGEQPLGGAASQPGLGVGALPHEAVAGLLPQAPTHSEQPPALPVPPPPYQPAPGGVAQQQPLLSPDLLRQLLEASALGARAGGRSRAPSDDEIRRARTKAVTDALKAADTKLPSEGVVTGERAYRFIKSFHAVCRAEGLRGREGLDTYVHLLTIYLSGRPEMMAFAQALQADPRYSTPEDVLHGFISTFAPQYHPQQLLRQLHTLQQREGESVEVYYLRFRQLVAAIDPVEAAPYESRMAQAAFTNGLIGASRHHYLQLVGSLEATDDTPLMQIVASMKRRELALGQGETPTETGQGGASRRGGGNGINALGSEETPPATQADDPAHIMKTLSGQVSALQSRIDRWENANSQQQTGGGQDNRQTTGQGSGQSTGWRGGRNGGRGTGGRGDGGRGRGGRGNGGRNRSACFRCGQEGHYANNCLEGLQQQLPPLPPGMQYVHYRWPQFSHRLRPSPTTRPSSSPTTSSSKAVAGSSSPSPTSRRRARPSRSPSNPSSHPTSHRCSRSGARPSRRSSRRRHRPPSHPSSSSRARPQTGRGCRRTL